ALHRAHDNLEALVEQRTQQLARANESLHRSEAFLVEGQRISHTGSWGWVLSTGCMIWSEEQYRMLGFEPAGAQPSFELFLRAVHPDDRSRVQQSIEQATHEKAPYAIDYRVMHRDGTVRHLHSLARPVVTVTGTVDEYIGVSTDISERVHADAALKRSQERYALAMEASGEGH